ncbi:MAG: leucine-rich repeat protein, partial [Firmicutes bacterium]|nr:leucine-rich repeat protein [Bacillota bacterium]
MKKYFKFLFAFVLSMIMLCGTAMAAPREKIAGGTLDNGILWSFYDDGELFIYKADSMPITDMPDYTDDNLPPWYSYFEQITSIVLDVGVSSVGDYAFYGLKNAETVEIREEITSIGDSAFYNCENLEEFELYESIETLGDSCFYGCRGFESIEIPSKVTEIPGAAFMFCTNLEELILPEGITSIGGQALCMCSSLEEIELPSTLETIGYGVFGGSSINKLRIPKNVSYIHYGAFENCDNLEKFTVHNDNDEYKGINGVLYTKDGKVLVAVPGALETLVVENGTEVIEIFAASGNDKLTEVIIPEGVTEINAAAFSSCPALETVKLPLSLESIANDVFGSSFDLEKVEYAGSIADWVEIEIGTGNEPLTSAELICAKSSVIEGECGANSIIRWKLENNVLTITGEGEIKDYTVDAAAPWTNVQKEIKKVVIGDEITAIGNYAFDGCEYIEEVSLPDGLERLGEYAFCNCKALEEIDIPSSVDEIGGYAFWGCDLITEVVIPEGVENIYSGTFVYCDSLESVTIPEGVTFIGSQAFTMCSLLDNVILPESLEEIASYAFELCDSLTEITIGKNVSIIGDGAFGGCNNLEGIYVDEDNPYFKDVDGIVYTKDGKELVACPGTVEVLVVEEGTEIIRNSAVNHNWNLVSVTMPEGVTEIGTYAFGVCYSLEDVTIPESMEKISNGAFDGNTGLVNVYYQSSEEDWIEIQFAIHNEELFKVKPYMDVEGTVSYENGDEASGVTVQLLYESGKVKDTTTTDSKGRYKFEDVEIGRFIIRAKGTEENISIKRK